MSSEEWAALRAERDALRERLEFSEQTTTNVMNALADSGAETTAAEQRAEAAEAQVERVRAVVADAPALMLAGGYIDVFIPADNIRAALDGPEESA